MALAHGVVSVVLRWTVGAAFLWMSYGLIAAMANVVSDGRMRRSYTLSLSRRSRVTICLLWVLLSACAAGGMVLRPFRAELLLRRGVELVRRERWQEAAGLLEAAIARDALMLRAYYQLAHVYWSQGEAQRSVETYRALQAHAPDYAQVHYNLGVTYAELGRVDEACTELLVALRSGTMPRDFKLGRLADRLGGAKKGSRRYRELLEAVLEAGPRDKVAWSLLGLWHQEQGELDEAAECYQKAIEIDGSFAPALNNLGGVYFEKGELGQAAEVCQRVLQTNPKDPRTHLNLGRIYLKEGDVRGALRQWRLVLAIDPDCQEARDLIADLERRLQPTPPSPGVPEVPRPHVPTPPGREP